MAEFLAIPSCVKLQFGTAVLEEQFIAANTSHLPTKRSCKVVFSPLKPSEIIFPWSRRFKKSPRWKTPISCCFSAVAQAGGSLTLEWIPFVDQVLLVASITLAYMAGVITNEKISYNTPKSIPLVDLVPENTSSTASEGNQVSLQFTWDVVKGKLIDSLSAFKDGVNFSENVGVLEKKNSKEPLSLSAITLGPRIRLLWASFQLLNKEVDNISIEAAKNSGYDFSSIFTAIVKNCCQTLWMAWMEEELHLVLRIPDKDLLSFAANKLNGCDSIIQSIKMSGKEDLYMELVYALRFGSLRKGSFYNYTLFSRHGVAILEDFLITLADGIASMYLELISVDSGLSNEIDKLGLSFCPLSTRALQRLRNELWVALNQWLHQNMKAVISMYEDQFGLCTLESQPLGECRDSEIKNSSWWNMLNIRSSAPVKLRFVVINNISIPAKRTKELRALTGWRFYFSLFLELTDIAMPFVRTVIGKVSDAISFFLFCLIGRSLGLIFSGIRNSLRLK